MRDPTQMKPSQNPLFKADTSVRPVAESGILGLVHGRTGSALEKGSLVGGRSASGIPHPLPF